MQNPPLHNDIVQGRFLFSRRKHRIHFRPSWWGQDDALELYSRNYIIDKGEILYSGVDASRSPPMKKTRL